MFFSYESAVREAKRICDAGGRARPERRWYGWIVVDWKY